jgi:hypothetical protein
MAKTTKATIHQEVDLQNKGIEIEFWNDEVKGGRLVIKKATIEWYEANAKTPTWTGNWEDLATTLSSCYVECEHCQQRNTVRKGTGWHTCISCGKRIVIAE